MTERPIARIALIGDTHINPVDGESGSPWPSNRLANERARWLVARLNAEAPDRVIHLGDMVHPIPAQPGYDAAVARFRAIFDGLTAPLHVLPGNHDLGDKPVDWMPAHPVDAPAMDRYRAAFGPLWQVVDHDDLRFVLHCSPLLGADLDAEAAQAAWLARTLDASTGKRVFFCTHYPLFLTDPDEPEHYDNIGAGRYALLSALRAHGVEAAFAAHVHTIFHTGLGADGAEPLQHVVPAVSAIRHDFGYRFDAPPAPDTEFGRNERAKLGYMMLEIFEKGYRLRLRRSYGQALAEGTSPSSDVSPPVAYRGALTRRPIGVDLRLDWAATRGIPHTGVVDEFRRKSVRNDDLIAALQEAGLRDLRVPIDDILSGATARRMREVAAMGHRFHVFSIDPPGPDLVRALTELRPLVTHLEVVARPSRLADSLAEWRMALGSDAPLLMAAPIGSSADDNTPGSAFAHRITCGFSPDALTPVSGADGAVLRIAPGIDPEVALSRVAVVDHLTIHLGLANPNPAAAATDDTAQADRIDRALRAKRDSAILLLDTLTDFDRGYFPRHGPYDARCNPREAALRLAARDFSF